MNQQPSKYPSNNRYDPPGIQGALCLDDPYSAIEHFQTNINPFFSAYPAIFLKPSTQFRAPSSAEKSSENPVNAITLGQPKSADSSIALRVTSKSQEW